MFFTKLFAALAAATVVSAATNIVVNPHITAPVAGDLWTVGSVKTITWDTSDIPVSRQTQTGLILLGHLEDGQIDEHLDGAHPLASNFLLTAGAVNVTVPDVDPRDSYIVVLFGDSGNASPEFTIAN